MVRSRRNKTQKGSGVYNTVKSFITGQKPDQVPQAAPNTRNWENVVVVNSPVKAPVAQDHVEAPAASPTARTVPAPPTAPTVPAPASPTVPAPPTAPTVPAPASPTVPASPAVPAVPAPAPPPAPAPAPIPAQEELNPNAPSDEDAKRIVSKFFNLLIPRSREIAYNTARAAGFSNPILSELSRDHNTGLPISTPFKIINLIPNANDLYRGKLGEIIGRGTYGTIYKNRTDPTRIIKQIIYNPATGIKDKFLIDCLRETFIQFYLSEGVPGSVAEIYSFAKQDVAGLLSFFVEMEYITEPYINLWNYFNNVGRTLSFATFRVIINNICHRHKQLEQFAAFVHRDFKPDNIMFNKETGEIKFIDFGFSFIVVPPEYYIVNNEPIYETRAAIRFQQDMGLFMILFRQYFLWPTEREGPIITNRKIREFIQQIIPPSIMRRLNYRNAYNYNGSVYASANTEILTSVQVMDALDKFDRTGRITGGNKTRRRCRSRKSNK